jgi:hypothetical protein
MEYVGGAYSDALLGHASAQDKLTRPFDQRLFLAGEATQRHDFSTAHGAYQSGTRAAKEVVSALKRPHETRAFSDYGRIRPDLTAMGLFVLAVPAASRCPYAEALTHRMSGQGRACVKTRTGRSVKQFNFL